MAKKTTQSNSQETATNASEESTQSNSQETKNTLAVEKDLVAVKFIKCPTGAFGLAYNSGDTGKVTPEMAEALIASHFAEKI